MKSAVVHSICGAASIVAVCAAVVLRPPPVRVVRIPTPVCAPVPAPPLLPLPSPPSAPKPVAPADAAPPRVLLDDGFDAENGGTPVLMYHRFRNWTVEGGTVDLVGAGSDWDFQPGNGLYVDLDGDRPDGIHFASGALVSRQAFDLAPGSYALRFRMAGSQRGDVNTTTVSLGGVFRTSLTLAPDSPFREYRYMFTVRRPASARLRFKNLGADGYGLLLDAVALVRLGRTGSARPPSLRP